MPDRSGRADIRRYGVKLRRFLDAFRDLPLSQPFDLDDRNGAPPADLVVIGNADHAREIWTEARTRFATQPEALEIVRQAATEAGLGE